MLMGRDIPHFWQYIQKELKKELKNPILPGPVTTKMSMAVTRAQLIRQTALEEEKCLRQERDGDITTELYLVGGGKQTKAKELRVEDDLAEALWEGPVEEQEHEGLKGENQLEECPAEVLREDPAEEQETEGDGTLEDLAGALTEVLTWEGLGEAQRYDKTFGKIRKKAGKEETYPSNVAKYMHTLRANMKMVREMAYERERERRRVNKRSTTMRVRRPVPSVWGTLFWCLDPLSMTNCLINGRDLSLLPRR